LVALPGVGSRRRPEPAAHGQLCGEMTARILHVCQGGELAVGHPVVRVARQSQGGGTPGLVISRRSRRAGRSGDPLNASWTLSRRPRLGWHRVRGAARTTRVRPVCGHARAGRPHRPGAYPAVRVDRCGRRRSGFMEIELGYFQLAHRAPRRQPSRLPSWSLLGIVDRLEIVGGSFAAEKAPHDDWPASSSLRALPEGDLKEASSRRRTG